MRFICLCVCVCVQQSVCAAFITHTTNELTSALHGQEKNIYL